MKITYQLTCADYYEAYQVAGADSRRIRRYLILSTATLLFVASLWNKHSFQGRLSLTFAIVASMLLASFPFAKWLDKLSFENMFRRGQDEQKTKLMEVEISERGLSDFRTSSRQDWTGFSKYSESKTVFILYKGKVIEAIIPKRALDSESLESLRGMLQRNLTQR